jgi:hypothetical protein
MWVASNIHPKHSAYPEKSADDCAGSSFDECEAVGTGEYWDFKFTETGTWYYHNHMRARDEGTVIVVDEWPTGPGS